MDNFFSNSGKKISWVQIIFLICIILLSFCSFQVLLSYPAAAITKKTGIGLFAVGTATVIIAAIKKNNLKGKMWLLCDGAATIVLSVFILSGITSPLSFAIWEISLGLFKICEGLKLKRELPGNGSGFLFMGIAELVSGTGFFIKSASRPAELAIAIVITFSIQMSAYGMRYYFYPMMTED